MTRIKSQTSWQSRLPPSWALTAAVLAGLHLFLLLLSKNFGYDRDLLAKPIVTLVGVEMLAGALYLVVVRRVLRSPASGFSLKWIIGVGVLLRICLLTSTPMLEDDYNRYLWDGAVVAAGVSPYKFSPEEVLEAGTDSSVPTSLRELADKSDQVLWRVNHPHLRSIYPPVAQGAFALAHWLRPWSLLSWRFVLLAFDGATLWLLLLLLREIGRPLVWAVIYWWNPLVIRETFNAGHMDVVVLPLLLGALLFAIRKKYYRSSALLSLAMGVKLWPVVLPPLIVRPIASAPKKLILAACVFGLLSFAMLIPVYGAGFDESSGFMVYGQTWENNDAIFMVVLWAARAFLDLAGLHAQLAARGFVGFVLLAWIAYLARKKHGDSVEFLERISLTIAAVFLLSPAQFPWYYVWLVPFLALQPRGSLLVLTALLPLYYLRLYFSARHNTGVFDNLIVWFEYLPVWSLLIREYYVMRRSRSSPVMEAGV